MSETLSEVVGIDMPQRVLSEMKNVACIKTMQKTPRAAVTNLAMSSPDVPGSVVYQTTKETDPSGRLLRRSTLELVNYGNRPGRNVSGSSAANACHDGRRRPGWDVAEVISPGNWDEILMNVEFDCKSDSPLQ